VLLIPLGSRGTIAGTEWEVIGFMRRGSYSYQWSEYLLYNRWSGYRWLTEYKGHWNIVERRLDQHRGANLLELEDVDDFRENSTQETKVHYVAGEFYWRVRVGERARTKDYVRPLYLRSLEIYPELNEATQSQSAYCPAEEVARIFQLKELPKAEGVFANQPNPHAVKWGTLWVYVAGFLALITLIQLAATSLFGSRETVWTVAFDYQAQKKVSP
jgi:hypothetical protein